MIDIWDNISNVLRKYPTIDQYSNDCQWFSTLQSFIYKKRKIHFCVSLCVII
jgi:hypothetical protein